MSAEKPGKAKEMFRRFAVDGEADGCKLYGNGHINETFLITADNGKKYILQKINGYVFRNVDGVMKNIYAVTSHIAGRLQPHQQALSLVKTRGGKIYETDEDGCAWRMYDFVSGGVCLERTENAGDFMSAGTAFGQFQKLLSDFPAETLAESIPRFHDTPMRYQQLREAIEKDAFGRVSGAAAEIEGYLSREDGAGELIQQRRDGVLPVRVTHNDTKLNNVMLDKITREPLCVLDLDTVMPGLVADDFGDAIRYGASTAAEDEQDLSKVHFSLEFFEAFAKGFMSECADSLTQAEIKSLVSGARLMTLECGARFLADYLAGDVYFKVDYPDHNLVRCRTQLKLVMEMEDNRDKMQEIVEKYRK